MLTDPISDMLTRIRNAQLRGKKSVEMPYSSIKVNIAKVLLKNGFLEDVKTYKPKGGKFKSLAIMLKYDKTNSPLISKIERLSKPGLRKYVGVAGIKPVLGGLGITIISTSQGIMTGKEARKRKLGGEIVCKVY